MTTDVSNRSDHVGLYFMILKTGQTVHSVAYIDVLTHEFVVFYVTL